MKLLKAKEKKERALGTRLGLKAFRSASPKSAMTRRPYKPGVHNKKSFRGFSEYKQQLMEKQKMKISYGLTEIQMKKLFEKALGGKKSVSQSVIEQLESRLDNAVFRMGFAPSRIMGRQMVSHGLIQVNGRKVTIPSFAVKKGDVIQVKQAKASSQLFKDLPNILKKQPASGWFSVDAEALKGTIKGTPEEIELPFNLNMVVDYYAR